MTQTCGMMNLSLPQAHKNTQKKKRKGRGHETGKKKLQFNFYSLSRSKRDDSWMNFNVADNTAVFSVSLSVSCP